MAFWIFMVIMELLVPIIMIIAGASFLSSSPKQINYIVGYRTSMSMKKEETLRFAHNHCGKIWLWVGTAMIPLSIIPMLFVLKGSKDTVGNLGSVICIVQIAVIIISIFPVEAALRKKFDKDGNRKDKQ